MGSFTEKKNVNLQEASLFLFFFSFIFEWVWEKGKNLEFFFWNLVLNVFFYLTQ